VIVEVSGYSRTIVARMIPSREAHDILWGHLACLLELGGVPRKGVYDNDAALVSRHTGRSTAAVSPRRGPGLRGSPCLPRTARRDAKFAGRWAGAALLRTTRMVGSRR
jgi:hypothetical protein